MSSPTVSDKDRATLIAKALQAREGSYSPYSNFRVGACLLTDTGDFVTGANIENAAYSPGICAERTAVVKAVSEGKRNFVAIAVASDLKEPISPCGVCRQTLREFCTPDMPMFFLPAQYSDKTVFLSLKESEQQAETKDKVIVTTMGEILPVSFGPAELARGAQ